MLTFKDYIKEGFVHNGIKFDVHKDRMDFYKGGELIHTNRGDFSDNTKKHIQTAKNIATRLHMHLHNKGTFNALVKDNKFTPNYGKIKEENTQGDIGTDKLTMNRKKMTPGEKPETPDMLPGWDEDENIEKDK